MPDWFRTVSEWPDCIIEPQEYVLSRWPYSYFDLLTRLALQLVRHRDQGLRDCQGRQVRFARCTVRLR